MSKTHVIREFGIIYDRKDYKDERDQFDKIYLEHKSFCHLKDFIAENIDPGNEVDHAFSVHRKKGMDFIKVKNFVGVIETRNSTLIEILPKIYLTDNKDQKKATRQIFLRMLRHLRNSPFRTIDNAHLKTSKFPILEIFISSFISELETLIRKGLKQHYLNISENNKFLKGKIDFANHLKENLFRKERFYVSYDLFSTNIPHNRIIKSTLFYLANHSKTPDNQFKIKKLLTVFDEIDFSCNLEKDFSQIVCNSNRLYSHYSSVIRWARVFLMGESFTNFKGNNLNKAILFPMERIFEDYVTHEFKKHMIEYSISSQDKAHYLVEYHNGNHKFQIRPDIVLRKNAEVFKIIDTKWKIIDEYSPTKNYLISQSDMYQLYAYGKKYSGDDWHPVLYLIYPKQENFSKPLYFTYNQGLDLIVVPFDLENTSERTEFKLIEGVLSPN
jgi:5-methylcytosine-specific restriction enzyme subunit McrC